MAYDQTQNRAASLVMTIPFGRRMQACECTRYHSGLQLAGSSPLWMPASHQIAPRVPHALGIQTRLEPDGIGEESRRLERRRYLVSASISGEPLSQSRSSRADHPPVTVHGPYSSADVSKKPDNRLPPTVRTYRRVGPIRAPVQTFVSFIVTNRQSTRRGARRFAAEIGVKRPGIPRTDFSYRAVCD